MATAVWVILAAVLCAHRGEAGTVQSQTIHSLQSKVHHYPATGPARTVEEGDSNVISNGIVNQPSKVPFTFSAGSPRNDVGEDRRFRRGILRRLALPLLILLGIKTGLTLPVVFGAVALAAFKGLWTGSSALLMTAAMALRGLIPPPKIIIPTGHAHVHDYIADYRRTDPYYSRDDYRYGYK